MFVGALDGIVGKLRWCAAVTVILSSQICGAPVKAADVPTDFKITLVSASLGAPRNPADSQSVTINASGTATLSPIPTPTGILPAISLKLDVAAVSSIYQAVQAQRFFDLKPEYRDPDIRDGDEAILTVTAAGKTMTVTSVNIRVLAFDIIAVAIDRALPPEHRLQYNALTDPRLKGVER